MDEGDHLHTVLLIVWCTKDRLTFLDGSMTPTRCFGLSEPGVFTERGCWVQEREKCFEDREGIDCIDLGQWAQRRRRKKKRRKRPGYLDAEQGT